MRKSKQPGFGDNFLDTKTRSVKEKKLGLIKIKNCPVKDHVKRMRSDRKSWQNAHLMKKGVVSNIYK